MTDQYIYVIPAEGSRVRNPQNNYEVISAEGAQVKKDRYFNDRLLAGELTEKLSGDKSADREAYAPKEDEKEYYSESDFAAPSKETKPKK